MSTEYTIRIRVLENGFMVEVPDMEEIKKKEAAAKKDKNPSPYVGDCVEGYAAKTVPEVIRIVKESLSTLGDEAYAEAFDEASKGVKT